MPPAPADTGAAPGDMAAEPGDIAAAPTSVTPALSDMGAAPKYNTSALTPMAADLVDAGAVAQPFRAAAGPACSLEDPRYEGRVALLDPKRSATGIQ